MFATLGDLIQHIEETHLGMSNELPNLRALNRARAELEMYQMSDVVLTAILQLP